MLTRYIHILVTFILFSFGREKEKSWLSSQLIVQMYSFSKQI